MQFIVAGNAWAQEHKIAGHMAATVRAERFGRNAQFMFLLSSGPQSMSLDGAVQIQKVPLLLSLPQVKPV